jgi:hypothetical protein
MTEHDTAILDFRKGIVAQSPGEPALRELTISAGFAQRQV